MQPEGLGQLGVVGLLFSEVNYTKASLVYTSPRQFSPSGMIPQSHGCVAGRPGSPPPVAYDQNVLDLVLLRHGQSTWNAENLFTGWVDVDLTEVGEAEARDGGRLLGEEPGLDLRILHTSLLTRAIRTAELALAAAGRSWLPVQRDWRLNERHYGDLQGKNKAEIMAAVRERTAAAVAPELRHPAAPAVSGQSLFQRRRPPLPRPGALGHPATECLADVVARALPYWEAAIVPDLRRAAETNSAILVVAHGNSIRALRKHLEGISDADIPELEMPTGIPFRMLLNDDLTVHSSGYLGDPAAAAAAAAAVSRQAG